MSIQVSTRRALSITLFFLIIFIIITILGLFSTIDALSLADSTAEETEEIVLTKDTASIPIQSYVLDDNVGYYVDEARKTPNATHPLLGNYIDLSVVATGENTVADIEEENISATPGYGITGSSVAIHLKYNFDTVSDI
ncbi:MAG: hypothetical protein LBD17_01770 [Endomicrobium sp.]|jgi:hypothetical protein|nr:hypothetical protein [Endomicrobium sp.]